MSIVLTSPLASNSNQRSILQDPLDLDHPSYTVDAMGIVPQFAAVAVPRMPGDELSALRFLHLVPMLVYQIWVRGSSILCNTMLQFGG